MNDTTLFEKAKELLNQYNPLFLEHGIEIKLDHRSLTEAVEKYNSYGGPDAFDLLEYSLFDKKAEEKKYHHVPNRYKMLVLKLKPLKKTDFDKKDCKEYAFLVYSLSRAHQGIKPLERQFSESSVIEKIEKRLKKLLKKAEKSALPDWCHNTLWDALRYTHSKKYAYIKNCCGKSRSFWETFYIIAFALPLLLFAIGGLIFSLIS